ncbi:hypothetical protein M427DRAFT_46807 [Gonapodya prolifera JEL478]|uniref:Uncharacterized protein n=1 Tax=Gonapodya prolifera (strain JEL478) TaxID=1344416 RepID=A0A139A4S7_GONPJ|nr:hypothetical protein M427DRAFT_46807 [Gonapodya prolifera JEL478]|eukprot:KXS11780.1 hypothetical protein M427DRAFT_46807 [Gonapodya prolifera JEL478]
MQLAPVNRRMAPRDLHQTKDLWQSRKNDPMSSNNDEESGTGNRNGDGLDAVEASGAENATTLQRMLDEEKNQAYANLLPIPVFDSTEVDPLDISPRRQLAPTPSTRPPVPLPELLDSASITSIAGTFGVP